MIAASGTSLKSHNELLFLLAHVQPPSRQLATFQHTAGRKSLTFKSQSRRCLVGDCYFQRGFRHYSQEFPILNPSQRRHEHSAFVVVLSRVQAAKLCSNADVTASVDRVNHRCAVFSIKLRMQQSNARGASSRSCIVVSFRAWDITKPSALLPIASAT